MRRQREIYQRLDTARKLAGRVHEGILATADPESPEDHAKVATAAALVHLEAALRAIADELRDHESGPQRRYGPTGILGGILATLTIGANFRA